MLLATALRLFGLGDSSLWIDEGYSLRDAGNPSAWMDVRPLYFIMLHFWMYLGHSAMWLRMLSVIFGIGSVALIYMIGQRLFNSRVGILAALLMAISPLHINHSQEIRMYSLTTFLVSAEVLFFIRYVEKSRVRDLLICLLFVGLAFMTHPLTVLMLLVFNAFYLFMMRKHRAGLQSWVVCQGIIGLAAIPFVHKAVGALQEFGGAWVRGMAKPGLVDVMRATRDFSLWQIPLHHHDAVIMGDCYGLFVLGLAICGGVLAYRKAPCQTALVSLWLAVIIVAMAIISNFMVNVWMVRYMIYASPALYLLIALALSMVKSRGTLVLALVAVLIMPVSRLGVYYGAPHRPEWKPAISYVQQHLAAGDSIAVYRFGYKYVFDYYYTGTAPHVELGPQSLEERDSSDWSDRQMARMMSVIPHGSARIWFMVSDRENTGEGYVEDYIRAKYHVIEEHDYDRVRVYLVTPQQQRL